MPLQKKQLPCIKQYVLGNLKTLITMTNNLTDTIATFKF